MDDPYVTLGVSRTATTDEIRAAFRKLAKKHHPDLNPGDAAAAERFKALSAAHELLSDPDKRARFDRGEIDATGAEKPPEQPFYRDFAQGGGRRYASAHGQPIDPENLDELLAAFGARPRADGRDLHYALTVSFLDAAKGAQRRLTLPDGSTLDVTIPAGLEDGQVLRLRGKGAPAQAAKGKPGDALIEVQVAPHPFFRRDGKTIELDLPVTLKEAILGGKVNVPTIDGPVAMTLPANAAGKRMRLKGRGIAGGDQYVVPKPVMPDADEPELAALLKDWTPRHDRNPREGMS